MPAGVTRIHSQSGGQRVSPCTSAAGPCCCDVSCQGTLSCHPDATRSRVWGGLRGPSSVHVRVLFLVASGRGAGGRGVRGSALTPLPSLGDCCCVCVVCMQTARKAAKGAAPWAQHDRRRPQRNWRRRPTATVIPCDKCGVRTKLSVSCKEKGPPGPPCARQKVTTCACVRPPHPSHHRHLIPVVYVESM